MKLKLNYDTDNFDNINDVKGIRLLSFFVMKLKKFKCGSYYSFV